MGAGAGSGDRAVARGSRWAVPCDRRVARAGRRVCRVSIFGGRPRRGGGRSAARLLRVLPCVNTPHLSGRWAGPGRGAAGAAAAIPNPTLRALARTHGRAWIGSRDVSLGFQERRDQRDPLARPGLESRKGHLSLRRADRAQSGPVGPGAVRARGEQGGEPRGPCFLSATCRGRGGEEERASLSSLTHTRLRSHPFPQRTLPPPPPPSPCPTRPSGG
jgi:hypothetical protein